MIAWWTDGLCEANALNPQVCVCVQRVDMQIVEVLSPQITEDMVEEFSETICEQTVDFSVRQVDVHEITNAIEAVQLQVRAISNEIQEKHSGKEEFLTKKQELRMQLDECSKKIDALREQNPGILGQVGDRAVESDLERNMPEFSKYNQKEEDMKGLDPCLSERSVVQNQQTDGFSHEGERLFRSIRSIDF